MYDYSPETCLIKDVDGQLYNIIDLWRGIKQPVDPSTIKKAYAPRTCLVENIDGTTVNIIDTILTVANGSGAGTSCLQEVIQARNEYKTLDERLDTENMKIYETLNAKDYLPFKGEYITVPHSKVGYTKGLKIQGKTYQNLFRCTIQESGGSIFSYNPTSNSILFQQGDYTIKNTSGKDIFININSIDTDTHIRQIKVNTTTKITLNSNEWIKLIEAPFNNAWTSRDKNLLKEQCVILEGDYTNKYIPPYFEGIKSVGEEENNKIDILSKNKNFLPYNNVELKGTHNLAWYDALGSTNASGSNTALSKTFFYVPKGYLRLEYERLDNCIVQLVTRNEKIVNIEGKLFEGGEVMLRIRNKVINEPMRVVNAMVTINPNQTFPSGQPYEPYQAYSKETLLPYNYGLKGLSNTVYDEIVDNKVIQRVERIILNGTEDWIRRNMPTENNTIGFGIQGIYINNYKIWGIGLSNRFNYIKDANLLWNVDNEGFNCADFLQIRINKNKLETQDVAGFKKWLQANPVTVYYELAEPVVHNLPIDNKEMKTYDDITYISSINAINPYLDCQAPSNPQAVVADLMVANESLSNELDVKTKELQAKDEHLMNENDLLTAKDLDMDFRIFELEEQLTPEVAKLSLSHNSPYLMIERCIERGLYEKEDMLYKMGRYLHGKRLTQEEYDKLKLMMG